MSALGTAARIISDPEVRALAVPLVREIVAFLSGSRAREPLWLARAAQELPALQAPLALALAKGRRGG